MPLENFNLAREQINIQINETDFNKVNGLGVGKIQSANLSDVNESPKNRSSVLDSTIRQIGRRELTIEHQ